MIKWVNARVRLGDLKPWAENPRMSTKAQAKRILRSFEEFGQVEPIAIGPDNEVYNGHQRLSALLAVHGEAHEVDARRASRALSDDERRKLTIYLHAGAVGSWDWDTLSGWDAEEMTDWGLSEDTLSGWRRDVAALGAMLSSESDSEKTNSEIHENWLVIVVCVNEAQQVELLERLNSEGYKCRALVS